MRLKIESFGQFQLTVVTYISAIDDIAPVKVITGGSVFSRAIMALSQTNMREIAPTIPLAPV